MPDLHGHSVTCPVCGRFYSVRTPTTEEPTGQPCGSCWRDLPPPLRARWLRALRAEPPARRALAHRDPVAFAPPTLQAYVEALEAELRQR